MQKMEQNFFSRYQEKVTIEVFGQKIDEEEDEEIVSPKNDLEVNKKISSSEVEEKAGGLSIRAVSSNKTEQKS